MRYCPLIASNSAIHQYANDIHHAPCLQQGCAWWDTALGQCSMVTLAQKSREILDLQEAIRRDTPWHT